MPSLPSPAPERLDPPAARAPTRQLRALGWRDPFRWLGLGAKDLRAAPGISLFYGLCFWGMALLLGAVFRRMPISANLKQFEC